MLPCAALDRGGCTCESNPSPSLQNATALGCLKACRRFLLDSHCSNVQNAGDSQKAPHTRSLQQVLPEAIRQVRGITEVGDAALKLLREGATVNLPELGEGPLNDSWNRACPSDSGCRWNPPAWAPHGSWAGSQMQVLHPAGAAHPPWNVLFSFACPSELLEERDERDFRDLPSLAASGSLRWAGGSPSRQGRAPPLLPACVAVASPLLTHGYPGVLGPSLVQ